MCFRMDIDTIGDGNVFFRPIGNKRVAHFLQGLYIDDTIRDGILLCIVVPLRGIIIERIATDAEVAARYV